MRIALFTETFLPAIDGVVTRLRHAVEELVRLGDEVLVFAPSGGPRSYAGARIYGVPGVPFPLYPEKRLCPPHPGVGRALRCFRPDVIHVVNPVVLGAGGVYYARRLRVPLVASHNTNLAFYARYYGLGFAEGFYWGYLRSLHNRAAVSLCNSEATRSLLLKEGVKSAGLWPPGVDVRLFGPDRASPEWRDRLSGGRPRETVLLYAGRLAPEKHVEELALVLREVPDVRLAIVGDGPARKRLGLEFAGLPVVFTGLLRDDELAQAYASSDIFLFPSTTDTLGLAMVEASASGLPVVAARGGPSCEIVKDGVSGLLYEAGSVESLVWSVRRLATRPGLRKAMGEEARAAAEQKDWAASTRVLREWYEVARRAG